jgi:hypothetical protein
MDEERRLVVIPWAELDAWIREIAFDEPVEERRPPRPRGLDQKISGGGGNFSGQAASWKAR